MRRFDSSCSCLIRLSFPEPYHFRRRFRKRKQKFNIPYKQILRRSFKKISIKLNSTTFKSLVRLQNLRFKVLSLRKRSFPRRIKKKLFFIKSRKPSHSPILLKWSGVIICTATQPKLLLTTLANPRTKVINFLKYFTFFNFELLNLSLYSHYLCNFFLKFTSKVLYRGHYFALKNRSLPSLAPVSAKQLVNSSFGYQNSTMLGLSTEITLKKHLRVVQTLHYLEFFNQTLIPLSSLFRRTYKNLITYKVPAASHFRFYYYRVDRSRQSTDSQTSKLSLKKTSLCLQFPTLTFNTILSNNWLKARRPTLVEAFKPLTISRKIRRRCRRRYWRKWVRLEVSKWVNLTQPNVSLIKAQQHNPSSPDLNPLQKIPVTSSLLNNPLLWFYLQESSILVKYLFETIETKVLVNNGLFLKILSRTKGTDSLTRPFLSNLLPSLPIRFTIYRRILRVVGFSKFVPNVIPYYHYTLVQFLEAMSGKKVYIKFNPFIENSLTFLDLSRCLMWEQRVIGFRRILGPKIFLNESLRLIYLAIKNKDSTFLTNWIKAMLYRMSFWKYRLIFRYLRYVVRVLFRPYFADLGFKGLKVKLKGKISIAGNGRTRTLMYRVGQTSNATFDNRVNYNLTLVHTFTGVLGFQLWFYF
jgi:hypothetical protein